MPALNSLRSSARAKRPSPLLEALEDRTLFSGDVFLQTNLHSNGGVPANNVDPPGNQQLVNAWGLSAGPNTPFWISDNGTGLATVYNAQGVQQSRVVAIPGAGGQAAAPTGNLFNGTTDFKVTENGTTSAATFIFAGEDGGISGWSPKVDANNAILMVDHSFDGAVFKGITMANAGGNNSLLAADFHNGRIDEFDSSFHEITQAGAFQDPRLPAGFAPFNVQNVGGMIFVTFAKQDAAAHDDVAGNGNGFVDVFNPDGTLAMRLQHGGFLNSPWGVVQAPQDWGRFSGDILVGNFGSGHIDAFDPMSGHFKGQLRGTDHKRLTIDGLWALSFGNGAAAGDPHTLFFTAGPNGESDGLFGSLTRVSKQDRREMLAHRLMR